MKNLRSILTVLVLVNALVVAWLVLRRDRGGEIAGSTSGAAGVGALLSDRTMEKARYNLADQADRLNLILISMDALRWDRTGISGGKLGLTPNLDAFAEECVVFHEAEAQASWTLPSHMAVFTGRWPSVHGVTNKLRLLSQEQMVPTVLSPGIETFPDVLVRKGWTAAAFTGGAGVGSAYGYGRGFDAYLDDRPFAGMDYSAPRALAWLQKHRDAHFFLFLHGYDSHGQYPLPESEIQSLRAGHAGTLDGSIEENARIREAGLATLKSPGDSPDLTAMLSEADARFLAALYDRKVRDADTRLGAFLAELRSMDLLGRSVVILLSDHGDEFLEHKGFDHGHSLHEELTHVVFMIRFPDTARRQDIREPVRLFDAFPTVFDALGIDGPAGVDGRSLLPLLRGEGRLDLPVFSETDYRLFVHHRMVRRGSRKLILDLTDGEKLLYDLATDPGERSNVSSSDPRTTYEMEQMLRAWMETTRTNPQDYLGIRQKPITIF
jgi:arylsulfatase A-like enzyme